MVYRVHVDVERAPLAYVHDGIEPVVVACARVDLPYVRSRLVGEDLIRGRAGTGWPTDVDVRAVVLATSFGSTTVAAGRLLRPPQLHGGRRW